MSSLLKRVRNRSACWMTCFLLAMACLVLVSSGDRAWGQARSTRDKRPRRVYVPIEDLGVIIDRDRRGVMLERVEYDRLRALAEKNAEGQPRIPATLALGDVVYTAKPQGDQLMLDVAVGFRQFVRGWQTLRLPMRGVSVERATLAGKPARLARFLVARDKKTVSGVELFHDQVGTATLQLALSTPLASVGSDKVAAFGLVPASTATLEVHLPAGKHLLVDGLAVSRPAPADQPAVYRVPVGGRSDVRLSLTDRQAERAGDALVFASTAFGVGVAPGEVTWQAVTALEVFGQPLDEFVATVPRTLEITDVASSGLESWELADDPGDDKLTRITLRYRQRFTGSRRATFRGVMTTAVGQAWQVPRLKLSGVTSHIGQVVVQTPPGVRLQGGAATGVRRVAGVRAAAGAPVGRTAMRFDAWSEDFTLVFATETKRQELQASLATILSVSDRGLDMVADAQIESLFSSLFQTDFSIPVGWNVTEVRVAGKPVIWARLGEANGRLKMRVAFDKPVPEGATVEMRVTAHRDLENWPLGSAVARDVGLPDVALEHVAGAEGDASGLIVEGTYGIRAPDVYDVVADELKGLDQATLDQLAGLRLGYTYQSPRISGSLKIGRRPARLSAESVTVARLDQETLSAHLESRLTIGGGGARSLVVELSDWVGSGSRFRLLNASSSIVEQSPAEPADGRRRWTLKLDEFARNQLTVAVDLTLKRSDVEDGAGGFRLPTITVVGAERDNGYVAIEASDDQRIDVTALESTSGDGDTSVSLAEIDPIDLPSASYHPRERIVKAYRYLVPGYEVTLGETRFDHGSVARAVCHSSVITSILAQTGEMQHKAQFDLTAAGVQSLLVDLAGDKTENRTLWAVTVDGAPVKAHRQRGDSGASSTFVVGWPVDASGAGRHTLEVFYRSRIDEVTGSDQLIQNAPVVSLKRGSETQLEIEVLEQSWVLHHPQQTLVVGSEGRFEPNEPLSQVSLLGAMRDSFDRVSPGDLANRLMVLGIVAAVVAFLTLAFRRKRAVGLVTAGVAVVFVMIVLPALLLSTSALSFKAADTSSPASMVDYEMVRESADADMTAAPGPSNGAVGGEMGGFGGMGGGGFAPGGGGAPMADAEMPSLAETPPSEGPPKSDDRATVKSEAKKAAPVPARRPQSQTVASGRKPKPQAATPPPGGPPTQAPSRSTVTRNDRPTSVDPATAPAASRPEVEPSVPQDALAGLGQTEGTAPLGAAGEGRRRSGGAVMSLALDLKPPAGTIVRNFHFLGSREHVATHDLQIDYQDLESQSTGRGFFAILVLLACWFTRRRPVIERSVALLAATLGPVALVTTLPVSWHLLLDGLFLGALSGAALWGVVSVVQFTRDKLRWDEATRAVSTGAGLLVGLVLAGQVGMAQSPPAKVQPAVDSVGVPVEVVPLEKGQDPSDAKRVVVSRDEFLRLWNLAYPDRQVLPPATQPGVVADVSWRAQVLPAANGAAARVAVHGDLQLYSFRDGQVVLPIPIGAVAIGGAKLDGKPAPLVTRAKSRTHPLAVVVDGKGPHRLEIDCELPLVQTGPAGQFSLVLGPAPVGRLRFDLPDKDLAVRVNGSSTRYRRLVEKAGEAIELPVDGGGAIRVSWQPKQATDEAAEGLVQLESYTVVRVSDPGVHRTSHFRFRVRQGDLPEVAFALPEGLRVQGVTGADVGGWDVETENEQRRLRVFFRRRIDDETVVQVAAFQAQQIQNRAVELTVASLGVVGFERDKGQVALFVDNQFTTRVLVNDNLKQVDVGMSARPAWCGPAAAHGNAKVVGSPRLAYGHITRPFRLRLMVSRRVAESSVSARHAARIEHRKVRLASLFRWQLTEAAQASVTLAVPEGYLPVGVEATSLSDWFVHVGDNGQRQLTVEFDGPRTGAVEVAIEGRLPRVPEASELDLPLPKPLGTRRMTTQMMVWLDEAYTAGVVDRGNWRDLDPAIADRTLRQLDSRKAQLAFVMGGNNITPVRLSIRRAVPGFQATVVALVTVTDTLVDHSLALSWQITQAAADEFVFTTPAWLAGRLQLKDPRIREVRSLPLGEGPDRRIRWTVTLSQSVRDRLFLIAQATLPPPSSEDKRVWAPEVEFERVVRTTDGEGRPVIGHERVDTQQRYAILINQSTGTLALQDETGLERVEKEDLGRLQVKIETDLYDQATGLWRISRRAAMPSWVYMRPQALKQTTAKVQLAELVTVLAADGSWRTEAVYTIRNRAQQFLAVQAPAGSRVLAVSVNGVQSRPVDSQPARDYGVVLVALPNTSEGDLAFPVRIIMAGTFGEGGELPEGFRILADTRSIPVPRVVPPADQKNVDKRLDVFRVHGMRVEETSWTVHLPNDLDVEPVEGEGTNLALVDSERLELNRQRAKLMDANYLLGVLESKSSSKSKYNANAKLKVLGVDLSNYSGPGSRSSRARGEQPDGKPDFQTLNRDFQTRYSQVQGRLQVDDSKQQVTVVDESGSLEGQDEEAQKEQIFRNNDQLLKGNSVVMNPQAERDKTQADREFNFKVVPSKPSGAPAANKKLPAKGRRKEASKQATPKQGGKGKAAVSGKLASRQTRLRQRAQSLSQFADLNKAAVNKEREDQRQVSRESIRPQQRRELFQNNMPGLVTQGQPPVGGQRSFATSDGIANEQPSAFEADGRDLSGDSGIAMANVGGGLSVDFEIPTGGQTLRFATTGDNPELELAMRPRESIQKGLNMLWTVAWLAVTAGIIIAMRKPGTFVLLKKHTAKALIGVGVISYLLLPGLLMGLGFALFIVGLVWLAVLHRGTRTEAGSST